MSNMDATRTPFFPKNKETNTGRPSRAGKASLPSRNTYERQESLKSTTKDDVRVDIDDSIKDFSRIKKAVDLAPPLDNSKKIEMLKNKINSGEYQIDYDAVADRILQEEF